MGKIERQRSAVNSFLEKLDVSGLTPSEKSKFENMAIWVMNFGDDYSDNVLEVSCGNGLLLCFIASIYPDRHFTGIDFEEEKIKAANAYKVALGLENVEFLVSDFTDLKQQFDTVLLFDTFDENVQAERDKYRFKRFDIQVDEFAADYSGYAYALAQLTAPSGKLKAVEHIDQGTELLGMLNSFNEYGMTFIDRNFGDMEYVDTASQSKVSFTAFELKKEPEPAENVFTKWAQKQLGDKMTPAKADYILFTAGGSRIEGYTAYDGFREVVFSGIFENKDDPGSFFIYRASEKGKNILRYPQNRMNEAKLTLTRDKEIDRKRGLNIIEFKPGGKAEGK